MEEQLLVPLEEEKVPVKTKKTPLSPEDKHFINTLTLLFSSLSARACGYAYFNVDKNVIILSNSTSSKTDEHGDRFINYSVPTLALHVIRLKDEKIEQRLRSFLKMPDYGYYCVNVLNLIGCLKKNNIGDLVSFTNEYGETIVSKVTRKTYDANEIVGWPVDNYHVIRELHSYYHQMEAIGTTEHRATTPHLLREMEEASIVTSRIFLTQMKMQDFRRTDGEVVFPEHIAEINVLGWDGLSAVAFKEFLKKVNNKPYTFMLYAWTVSDAYILSMTIFDNEWVNIRSMRPNILAIPIDKMEMTPTNKMILRTESDYGTATEQ